MEILPVRAESESLAVYARLFARCFPQATSLTPEYLHWLYASNPAGPVVGFDAWEGGRLAAHYVCIPCRASVNGEARKLLLSLNTATDPEFQGRGLFTRLAGATYAHAASAGFHGVYGIANANSTPGFVRKLGFDLVGPLDAKVGYGPVRAPYLAGCADRQVGFARIWDPASVAWRIGNPVRPYRLLTVGADMVGAQAPTGRPGLVAWDVLAREAVGSLPIASVVLSRLRLRLHLGLAGSGAMRGGLWCSLPERLRASPLNLIYRAFHDRQERIDRGLVRLGVLDFDAF